MPGRMLERIRECIREGRYDMTDHAWDEIAEDNLLLEDVETAILSGKIVREDQDDPRGTIYVLEGFGTDRTTRIGVAVRFKRNQRLLTITAYKS